LLDPGPLIDGAADAPGLAISPTADAAALLFASRCCCRSRCLANPIAAAFAGDGCTPAAAADDCASWCSRADGESSPLPLAVDVGVGLDAEDGRIVDEPAALPAFPAALASRAKCSGATDAGGEGGTRWPSRVVCPDIELACCSGGG
jgi:hypothetical protein